jgi:hypothetical protein
MSYRINIETITLVLIICSFSVFTKNNSKKTYSLEFEESDDVHLLNKFDQYLETSKSSSKHEKFESDFKVDKSHDEEYYDEESDYYYDDFTSEESEDYDELNSLFKELNLLEHEKELYKEIYDEIYNESKEIPNGPIQTELYNYYEESDSSETYIEVEDSNQPGNELISLLSTVKSPEIVEDINFTKLATKLCY